jgi:hypothetical protein
MSSQKYATLVKRLLDRTSDGSLTWEETGLDGVFQASLPKFAVQVLPIGDDYLVRLIDADGEVIDSVSDPELTEYLEDSFLKMRDLYQIARRSALGVEKALDSILESLNEDEPF